jgi:hypothetical protein
MVLMPFFTLEIMILLFIFHILFDLKVENTKNVFVILFITSTIILSLLNFNIHHESVAGHKDRTKLVFKIKDLKELKKRKQICPKDTKYFGSYKYTGDALSAILVMPYFSDISLTDAYIYWDNIPLRFAVAPKQETNNPCRNE